MDLKDAKENLIAVPHADSQAEMQHEGSAVLEATPGNKLPMPLPQSDRYRRRAQWLRIGLGVLLAVGIMTGGVTWWRHLRDQLPAGIAWGNGRLESDEIDIATKFADRIAVAQGRRG